MTTLEKVAEAIRDSMSVGLSEDEKRAIRFAEWTCHDMAVSAIEVLRDAPDRAAILAGVE